MSSNKHSGLCSSRAHKSRKTTSKYYQNAQSSIYKPMNYTIYSQNVFLDNSFIQTISGEFDIEKYHQSGDLYKAAFKTPAKNLVFEKYNNKLKILETRNPEICDESQNLAVYNLSMRNSDTEKNGKYQQWQKIADTNIVLTTDVNSFESLGGVFEENQNPNFEEMNGEKINALTPDAFGCYANGGERYVGNLVLNNLGWSHKSQNSGVKSGFISISSGNGNNVYTRQNNEKFNLIKLTLTSGNKIFKIFTPKISIKRSETNKNNNNINNNNSEFDKNHDISSKDLACTNTVYCFSQMADGGYNTNKTKNENNSSISSGLPANVNRSPETVVKQTRNDWKHTDKQQVRANKAFLSKIKKNKSLAKYQATVCY